MYVVRVMYIFAFVIISHQKRQMNRQNFNHLYTKIDRFYLPFILKKRKEKRKKKEKKEDR